MESGTHRHVSYEVFEGGKDQYVYKQHGDSRDTKIVAVDDEDTTLNAVTQLNPFIHCKQMRRQQCDYGFTCVHHSGELHDAIMKIVSM